MSASSTVVGNKAPEARIRTIAVSINPAIIDKNKNGGPWATGWQDVELTAEQLAGSINQGIAFSAQFDGGNRRGEKFKQAGFIAVDVDHGMSIEEARAHEFVRNYATILYTTPSHDPNGQHRFRIVFATPQPIRSAWRWSTCLSGLAAMFGGDKKATDKARMFFGSSGSEPELFGNQLTRDALSQICDLGRLAARPPSNENADDEGQLRTETSRRSDVTIARDQPISCASGRIATIQQLRERTSVHCPQHDDQHASAFIVKSRRGQPGIHCSTCGKTFWIEGGTPAQYDFFAIEKRAREIAAKHGAVVSTDPVREIHIINERYLPPFDLQTGITVVKSPKGTGKTEQLQSLVRQAIREGKSVLLIGHRQTLLREISKRLGMHCYLDDEPKKRGSKKKVIRPDLYAVSVDSLPYRLKNHQPYNVVLIDEAEQVLSHATARTIKDPWAVYSALQHYVSVSPAIYLFDADINRITSGFVDSCRSANPDQAYRFWLNEYTENSRVYDLFEDDVELARDMLESLARGKRIFVVCNSKRRAKTFHRAILKKFGTSVRAILVTAEDKAEADVAALLSNIKEEILRYDVVIASPAIGTGIDITFPENAALIDVVYGFFQARINSHYDCDQQLGRVRNPKEVKIWMSEEKQDYETEPSVIRQDLLSAGDLGPLVTTYAPDGTPIYDRKNPILKLVASVYCAKRASQNRMCKLFIAHKEHNGWRANVIKKGMQSETMFKKSSVSGLLIVSDKELEFERVEALLGAEKIDRDTYEELLAAYNRHEQIGRARVWQIERFEVEDFYQTEITKELIEYDDIGRMRASIKRYEGLLASLGQHQMDERLAEKFESIIINRRSSPAQLMYAALSAAGMMTPTAIDMSRCITKADLGSFLKFCDEYSVTVERKLDMVIRKDRHRDPIKALNQFLDLIGLHTSQVSVIKKNRRKTYIYKISDPAFEQLESHRQRREPVLRNKANDEADGRVWRQRSKSKVFENARANQLEFIK